MFHKHAWIRHPHFLRTQSAICAICGGIPGSRLGSECLVEIFLRLRSPLGLYFGEVLPELFVVKKLVDELTGKDPTRLRIGRKMHTEDLPGVRHVIRILEKEVS